jgi:predicted membrane protein
MEEAKKAFWSLVWWNIPFAIFSYAFYKIYESTGMFLPEFAVQSMSTFFLVLAMIVWAFSLLLVLYTIASFIFGYSKSAWRLWVERCRKVEMKLAHQKNFPLYMEDLTDEERDTRTEYIRTSAQDEG